MLLVLNQQNTKSKNRLNKPINAITISLLLDFTIDFLETGIGMRAFYRAYKAKCLYKYKMSEDHIISWNAWRQSCVVFWKQVLQMDLKKHYICKHCGPKPDTLVVDGIAMGMQTKLLKKYINKMNLKGAPQISPSILSGSNFQERIFIKKPSNRTVLRNAASSKTWPIRTNSNTEKEVDPEFVLGAKRKRTEDEDTGMDMFWKLIENMDKNEAPKVGFIKLMFNLSTKTSTTSIFQVVDEYLLGDLVKYLKNTEEFNFVKGVGNVNMHQKMRSQYPVVTDIIVNLANEDGFLAKPLSKFLLAIINHTLAVLKSIEGRNYNDYFTRTEEEMPTQVFPMFPMQRERARYKKNCKAQDKAAWKDLCEKSFPTHNKLTPGLFIVTCGCTNKVVYGFSMMTTGRLQTIR